MTNLLLTQVSEAQRERAFAVVRTRMLADSAKSDVHAWRKLARPEQLPPEGAWRIWYLKGGRGGGKTWASAHTFAEWIEEDPGEYGVIAPRYADARDVCIEGESGLLAAFGTTRVQVDRKISRYVESWNRSMGELRLRNGAVVYADGADDGATRIQGHNLRAAWCSEIGLWAKNWQMAWEESVRYAVRQGKARIVADGTPKRGHPIVRLLINDASVAVSNVRTNDNVANLNPGVVEEWMRLYGGTVLGRQELDGDVLDDVPGAAWRREWIEPYRLSVAPPFDRATVGVDPAITTTEGSDATGIIGAAAVTVTPEWCKQMFANIGVAIVPDSHGIKHHEHYFVVRDLSAKASPSEWGHIAVGMYRDLAAGRIVAETNRGGEMVEHTIRTVDPDVSFKPVHATRGKITRAEPIASLYQQGKVHHIGAFPLLEDEMCSYIPGESRSPDRMDALVWALTDLAIKDEPSLLGMYRAQATAKEQKKEAA